ncbi:glycine cleavage system protein GcvH [Jiulongibacter sediminis]|jgi:glycine cleavage system H protein|uniref:Glycine cleavage system H protein n=1 Tax=Jiulongibacter sediminis TaxID=1605367 RepID=A0A0N8HAE1_9BACT|nr:glycine cleavage system protein GcvH [Jiulongibacter sediminis]KPM49916.1 glycine cleavage system protein H [Jiulongibacter sediminis]TBX26952.1 glycine cleavage system protein H [Jiulongibacter sediminis]
MEFPSELKYTEEHEWIKIEDGNIAVIGITEFAQSELGDIVFVEVETVDEELEANEVFGTIEAVKTVSDLFLPANGKVLEFNEKLNDEPELVNTDPYGDGWIIKMEISDLADLDSLLDSETYKNQIGQ